MPSRAVADESAAADLIDAAGIITVYPASPDVADLFHAHVGDPDAKTENKWDSPSGRVYTWRWSLARAGKAFYGTVVRKRPTFVTWQLVPAILRLVGDLRTPDELFDYGVISADAYKIARVLDGSEPLGTGDIRKEAGFPTGRDQSAAYHKGLAELENRLLITTEFVGREEEGMKHHALMYERRPEDIERANAMRAEDAVDALLAAYLYTAVYIRPRGFARHMRVPEADVRTGIERLRAAGKVEIIEVPSTAEDAYVTR